MEIVRFRGCMSLRIGFSGAGSVRSRFSLCGVLCARGLVMADDLLNSSTKVN